MSSSNRLPRPAVDLPSDLVRGVKEVAAARGATAAFLWHHWVVDAAALAAAGQGHRLPQERRAPRGSLRKDVLPARWPQGMEEFTRHRQLINAAGSSVPAVLRDRARVYLASGGDVLATSWPVSGRAELAA